MSNEQVIASQVHLAQWLHRLQDIVDQALSPAETLQVHTHVSSCLTCTHEYRRLLAIDASLRNEFSSAITPSPQFDRHLFASIARLEQDKRGIARRREQQEHAARLASFRKRTRELLRFQLGNIIAALATLAAASTTIVSMLPSVTTRLSSAVNKDVLSAQQISWLPHGWLQGWTLLPVLAVTASATIAVTAMWITRRIDRQPG
jgi:anti-sigma factor RsiW